jgi:hypothetical protein
VLPLLVVLAILGAIYLVRLVVGFVFASVGLLFVVALLVAGFVWLTRSKT